MANSTTHRLHDVAFTLSQRRHVEKAVAAIRNARTQADAESSKTIRDCDLDAKVKAQQSQPSASSPIVLAASMPPHVYAAALLALFVLVGGIVSLMQSSQLRIAGPREWRDGVEVSP